ncbi:Protein of unknown function [Flavobacterium aquidurense]|uniref:DUF2809 domain-containing protein n=1 Tax=Flavobacterium frigidimaris TaxID=262320 RepID=A0ABX4BKF2_FLAFR|nr:DUF2809 domain-containing protein [Flavobacterium frigidimaris]OXA76173.1 hypothetical protein B0A65_20220 [Flavobacterium frigidimaris]SDY31584.1 Protein of unknown function [Flavobacterium aquidurense]
MKKNRLYYFITFVGIIFLGILSRKTSFIPLYVGDLLYAVMMYVLIRIILMHQKVIQTAIISLLICYGIEFLQLYQGEWMIELRKTLFGRYVLGQSFLWTDIMAYTFGIAIAFIIDKILWENNTLSSV